MKALKLLVVPIILLVISSVVLFGCAKPAPAPEEVSPPPTVSKLIKWNLNSEGTPLNVPENESYMKALAALNERFKGRFEIAFFYGSSLVKGPESLRACSAGTVEASFTTTPYIAGDIPILDTPHLPNLCQTKAEGEAVLKALWPMWEAEMDKMGVKLLSVYAFPPENIFSKKPLTKLSDFQGLKIRVSGAAAGKAASAMGCSVITLPFSEIYPAMQRGTADAFSTNPCTGAAISPWEVTKYINPISLTDCTMVLFCNKAAFEALPPDIQVALLDTIRWSEAQCLANYYTMYDKIVLGQLVKERGMAFTEPEPEVYAKLKEIAVPIWEEWARGKGPKAAEALALARKVVGR
jgi:TRAP-type C4-dicarboxylate transport system substrate-binding protein